MPAKVSLTRWIASNPVHGKPLAIWRGEGQIVQLHGQKASLLNNSIYTTNAVLMIAINALRARNHPTPVTDAIICFVFDRKFVATIITNKCLFCCHRPFPLLFDLLVSDSSVTMATRRTSLPVPHQSSPHECRHQKTVTPISLAYQ